MKYYVYILKTVDDTLYCGFALDILKRFEEHKGLKGSKGAKYTRVHKPEKIVFAAEFEEKSLAYKEEYRIKHLKRSEKLSLIEEHKKETEKILKNFL